MGRDRSPEAEQDAGAPLDERRRRRPWALIAACLVLVVLTAVLWVKWSTARRDAARLQKELTRVYKEAEDLRLQAALARNASASSSGRFARSTPSGTDRPGRPTTSRRRAVPGRRRVDNARVVWKETAWN